MSTSFICKRCNFNCYNYNDIKRHINKKKICQKKNLDSFNYSEDQLLILSMIPYYNDKHNIENIEIEYLKNSNKMNNKKKELFEILDEIDKKKIKKCKYCNNEFQKIIDLRKHIMIKCFYENIEENNGKDKNIETNIINNNNCTINTQNQIQNITNNIYLEIKPPLPFDGDWDISKLDNNIRARLLISQIMYTTLLEEILKNDDNLNVIIDKESKSGMVYKNDKEQYITMKLNDIVDEAMEKLKNYLLEINEEAKNRKEFDYQIIRFGKSLVLGKYNDYKNYEGINEDVNELMANIFDRKKNEAIKKSKNIKIANKKVFVNGF